MIFDYIEDLLDWCKVKIFLAGKRSDIAFRDGEVWWCHVGLNIGAEMFGKGKGFKRPVLVFRKLNNYSFLGIPLTTQQKVGSWYVPIISNEKEVCAVLSQIKVFDARRLSHKIGDLGSGSFLRVKQAFLDLYGQ